MQVVAQPLHERPGDRDRALERVHRRLVADLVTDRGQQARLGLHGLGARVEQHEVAGAVRVLRIAGVEARLAERRRLLVAEVARDADAGQVAGPDLAVDLARGPDLGQHRHRHADRVGDVLVPGQRLEVHQHRPAGVRHVGDVQAAVGAAGQVPDAPGVHVAEHQVAGLGLLARAVDVVEDPADLRPREVRRQRQADRRAEPVLTAVGGQLVDELVGARVLPDDRVHHRLAGVAVPHDRGLALVGDAERGDVVAGSRRPSRSPRRSPPGSAPRPPSGRARPSPAWDRSARAPSATRRRRGLDGRRPSPASWSSPDRVQLSTSPCVFSFQPASASAALLKR